MDMKSQMDKNLDNIEGVISTSMTNVKKKQLIVMLFHFYMQ